LSFTSLIGLAAGWGAFAFPLYTLSGAHANDFADPEDFVGVSSGLLLVYGLGAIAGPFLSSTLMSITGARGLFAFTAVSHFAMLLFVIRRLAVQREADPAQSLEYSDAVNAAYTAGVYEDEASSENDVGDVRPTNHT